MAKGQIVPSNTRPCSHLKTVSRTTKPRQDGHFLQCNHSHQSHRSAAVQQESWLPARAAHISARFTSCLQPVKHFYTSFLSPPLSVTGRIRPQEEAEQVLREWKEWEGFAVFSMWKTVKSHAAHQTSRSAHQQFHNRCCCPV